jgi:hypothetical protein
MEENFNIEEEYEKYKASQRGPDTRPEWMKLAEEDLKGFLDKPEFRLSAEMMNWLNNKTSCPHCGKVISVLASKKHLETCKSNYDTISKLLTEDPDLTITEMSVITGFNKHRISNIFKTNRLVHKFSNPADFNKHEKYREKFLNACKKGAQTQFKKILEERKQKFKSVWDSLPEELLTLKTILQKAKECNLNNTKSQERFLKENWITMVYVGTRSSSTNPNLYVKNPDKSEDPNYQPVIVSESSIQDKLKDIRERFSEQMKINCRGTGKN